MSITWRAAAAGLEAATALCAALNLAYFLGRMASALPRPLSRRLATFVLALLSAGALAGSGVVLVVLWLRAGIPSSLHPGSPSGGCHSLGPPASPRSFSGGLEIAGTDLNLRDRVLADAEARMLAIKSERYAGSQPVFEVALERGHLDLAAHCLLVGRVEALREVPADALEALMDEIEGELPSTPRRRHSRRNSRGNRH